MLVAAANLSARSAGVRPQMRMSEASALTSSRPGTAVYPFDLQEDLDGLCQLAEAAQRFSPIVGLEQLDKKIWCGRTLQQPESILLDVTGIGKLFGGEDSLAHEVCSWLSSQAYFGCVAIAGSVAAAWALANYALRNPASGISVPVLPQPTSHDPNKDTAADQSAAGNGQATGLRPAEVVERTNAPDVQALQQPSLQPPPGRYLIADPGTDAQWTQDLPIAALRLQTETVTALRRLGINTIGQLQQLPRSGLASRLGEPLITRWDQVAGEKREPIIAQQIDPQWTLEQSIEHPTCEQATLKEIIRRLCYSLAERLARRGEGALRIVCRLDMLDSLPLVMQLGLFRPTNEAAHLEVLLAGQLEQHFRRDITQPVHQISMQASLTAVMQWRQGDLFDEGDAANRQQIASLVDSLSARLGRKSVLSVKVSREAQPELAYTLEPMTGRRNDGTQQQAGRKLSSRLSTRRAEPSRADPLRRPSHLFHPPAAIEVRMVPKPVPKQPVPQQPVPQQPQHAQASAAAEQTVPRPKEVGANAPLEGDAERPQQLQFKYQGSWYTAVSHRGPERLESGWWRGPSSRRDYYCTVTTDGSWWWLYRDMATNAWFLHGKFD